MAEKWIQDANIKKNALRNKLDVKEGHKIPEAKLEKAEHSKNPTTRKQAALAKTLRKIGRKRK